MEIAGKRILLTGATGGIGRAIAAALASRGGALVLSSRKAGELDQLAADLPGGGHSAVVSDLAEPGAAVRLAEDASAAGPVDILVANAGLPGSGRLSDFSSEEVARAVRVNLESPMTLAHALLPAMVERHEGHLLFVSSLAGKAASPRASVYNATKFGLRGFALALREDLEGDGSGVGVSVVLPGFIRDAGMFADSGARVPPGVGTSTPEEVAAGVVSAIERNRSEVAVAPIQQRAMAHLAHWFPGIAARAQRGRGTKIAERVAGGQADKR
ncbi:MAG: SDR family NAD(P)-dependent oxidoreductase [Solirubrobacterales bacterium]|nr:SDR family NAD(P)-dependent oxidoreductase [Solirubrobacterales bacterium]